MRYSNTKSGRCFWCCKLQAPQSILRCNNCGMQRHRAIGKDSQTLKTTTKKTLLNHLQNPPKPKMQPKFTHSLSVIKVFRFLFILTALNNTHPPSSLATTNPSHSMLQLHTHHTQCSKSPSNYNYSNPTP